MCIQNGEPKKTLSELKVLYRRSELLYIYLCKSYRISLWIPRIVNVHQKFFSSPKAITSGIAVIILNIEDSVGIYIFKNRLVFLRTSLFFFQNT